MKQDTYKKKCKLCDADFETTREWQKFCCREHQAEYWRVSLKEKSSLIKRIEELEQKILER